MQYPVLRATAGQAEQILDDCSSEEAIEDYLRERISLSKSAGRRVHFNRCYGHFVVSNLVSGEMIETFRGGTPKCDNHRIAEEAGLHIEPHPVA